MTRSEITRSTFRLSSCERASYPSAQQTTSYPWLSRYSLRIKLVSFSSSTIMMRALGPDVFCVLGIYESILTSRNLFPTLPGDPRDHRLLLRTAIDVYIIYVKKTSTSSDESLALQYGRSYQTGMETATA